MSELARVLDVSVEELAGKMIQPGGGATYVDRFANPGPRPSRSSGPSVTPAPGRPGMVRMQVDQIIDWRLAMRLFEELSKAAEAENTESPAEESPAAKPEVTGEGTSNEVA